MGETLEIYYQNVRGLKTKTKKFRSELLNASYDVILLCETWLRSDIFTSELFDDRYIVYRNDRDNDGINKNDGGGCAIAIRKELISSRVARFEVDNDIWVSIEQVNGNKTYFNVKYVEIGSKLDVYKSHFEKIIENVMSWGINDSFVLAGDYNLADTVTWFRDPLTGGCSASHVRGAVAKFFTNLHPSKVSIMEGAISS